MITNTNTETVTFKVGPTLQQDQSYYYQHEVIK